MIKVTDNSSLFFWYSRQPLYALSSSQNASAVSKLLMSWLGKPPKKHLVIRLKGKSFGGAGCNTMMWDFELIKLYLSSLDVADSLGSVMY